MIRSFYRCIAAITLIATGLSFLTAAEMEDLTAIVNRARERYAAVNERLKDLTVVQTTQILNPKKNSEIGTADMVFYKKGDKLRLETSAALPPEPKNKPGRQDTGRSIIIHDGKNAWMITPLLGKTKIANDDPSVLRAQQNWWNSLAKNARLAGTDVVQGKPAYVIENKDGAAAVTRFWVDREKLQLLQTEIVRDNVTFRTLFSDYRKAADITELPYRIEIFQNGALVSVTTVKSVEVNTGLSDTLFDAGAVKAKRIDNNLLKGSTSDQ